MMRISPNNLSIVKALIIDTSVGVMVIVGLLGEPELDCVGSLHVTIALGDVLAKRSTRVLELAVMAPPVGIVLGVGGKGVVPVERAHTDMGSSFIMNFKEVLRRALSHANARQG